MPFRSAYCATFLAQYVFVFIACEGYVVDHLAHKLGQYSQRFPLKCTGDRTTFVVITGENDAVVAPSADGVAVFAAACATGVN